MIKLFVNNRASLLPQLAMEVINKQNKPSCTIPYWTGSEEDDDESVLREMLGAFGWHVPQNDDDYWDEYYSRNDNSKDDEEDDPLDNDDDDYHRYFEPSGAVSTGIWDDDEKWYDVAHQYDSFEKSKDAIDKCLRGSDISVSNPIRKPESQPVQSNLFKNVEKNKKKEENDWRREILEESVDEDRKIYFYDNPRDEKSKQEFLSVDEFLMFCDDNDIYVDTLAKEDVEFYTQCHCGLDEYALSNGRKELRCSRSYGELMYDLYGSDIFFDDNEPIYHTEDIPY